MVSEIDFRQVKEDSADTLRWNTDRTKTYVRWYCGELKLPKTIVLKSYRPSTIKQLTETHTSGVDYWGPFSSDDFKTELDKSEWTYEV